MVISICLIPGVMLGFEWQTDDDSSAYPNCVVLDLFVLRVLLEF